MTPDETGQRQRIIDSLEPLFQRAREKGLWFRSNYQGFHFSPKEFRERLAKGECCWGPVNWELIDPNTLLKDEALEAKKVREHNVEIRKRMYDR